MKRHHEKHQYKMGVLAGAVALALAQFSAPSHAAALANCGDRVVNPFGSATAATAGFVDVYSAGASAPQTIIGAVANTLLPAATRTVVFNNNSFDTTQNGGDFRLFCGTIANVPAAFGGGTLNGKTLRFMNRAKGGSMYGVIPIARQIPVSILNFDGAVCVPALGAGRNFDCPESPVLTYPPDLGVTDVDLLNFQGLNQAADFQPPFTAGQLTAAERGSLTSTKEFDVIFGWAVSNLVYVTAGKTDFSKAEIDSIISQGKTTWADLGVPAVPGSDIHICRRAPGSGTQATWNAYSAGYQCLVTPASTVGNNSRGIATQADAGAAIVGGNGLTPATAFEIDPTTGQVIIEAPDSANVRFCLAGADNGTDFTFAHQEAPIPAAPVWYKVRWSIANPAAGSGGKWPAVGILSLDSAGSNGGGVPGAFAATFNAAPTGSTGADWNFTRIEGLAPTRDNGGNGIWTALNAENRYNILGATAGTGHRQGAGIPAAAWTDRFNFVRYLKALSADEPTLRAVSGNAAFSIQANPDTANITGAKCAWAPGNFAVNPPTCATAHWIRGSQQCQPPILK